MIVNEPTAFAVADAINGGQIAAHPALQFETLAVSAPKTYSVNPLGDANPGDPRIETVDAGIDAGAVEGAGVGAGAVDGAGAAGTIVPPPPEPPPPHAASVAAVNA
jgi:hypothetical protein